MPQPVTEHFSSDHELDQTRRCAEAWLKPGRFAALLGLLVVAAFPGVLLKGQTFTARDFGMFSFPVAYFHKQTFWHGMLPQWNPLSFCGVPFLAQWNTMVLYPGGLFYLLLPLPWSLSFFCLVHLFWGGLGMYYLARHWTQNCLAAGLAGLVFSFNGLALNFIMWPSHIATFSWFPWVLWLAQLGWQRGGRKIYWAILAGSMQMLAGGPETIVLTWVLLLALGSSDWIKARPYKQNINTERESQEERERMGGANLSGSQSSRKQITLRAAGMVALIALICAAQLLPFLELLSHSDRDSNYSATAHDWSMPIWGWANYLVPLFHTVPTAQKIFFEIGQYWTSSYYVGVAAVFLALVAVRRVPDRLVRLLGILVFLCLVMALGDRGLVYRGLRACFPGIGFVRYPVKFVILVSAVAPLLGAAGFAALTRRREQALGRFEWGCAIAIFLAIGVIIGSETNSPMLEGAWRNTFRNGLARAAFLSLFLFCTAIFVRCQGRRRILCGYLLLTLTWLDFVTHVPTQNPSISTLVYAPDLARKELRPEVQPRLGEGRVMLSARAEETLRQNAMPDLEQHYLVRRLSAFPNCNLLDEVPQVYGFFSLAPGFIGNLANMPYVHTNLDFSSVMDFMGVSRTTQPGTLFDWEPRPTTMPLVTIGQNPIFAEDQSVLDAFFKTNTNLRQVVFLPLAAAKLVSARHCADARVLTTRFENQRVEVEANGSAPSLLVVSQSWYPGWTAYVDGKPAVLLRANYAFQALQVPAGRHNVQIVYEDKVFLTGVLLSVAGLACWLGLWLLTRSQHNSTLGQARTNPALRA